MLFAKHKLFISFTLFNLCIDNKSSNNTNYVIQLHFMYEHSEITCKSM